VGKCYSFPDSESFAVPFVNCFRNTLSFTDGNVRISRFQSCSNGLGSLDARARELIRGIAKSPQQTETVNINTRHPLRLILGNTLLLVLGHYRSRRRPPPHSWSVTNIKEENEDDEEEDNEYKRNEDVF
jgi:hypothetical protein